MGRPEAITIIFRSAESNMTINFTFEVKKPKSEKDEIIVKILDQFSRLSPEKQESVMKLVDFLDTKKQNNIGQNLTS